MSVYPTRILLATDGSKGAELADKTGSELHAVHDFGIVPWYPHYPEGTDERELEEPLIEEGLQRISEQRARELLDAQVEKMRSAGGTMAQAKASEGRHL